MATVLRQGWEIDDPNKSSSIIKAKIGQVEIVSNISTGNFDIYETRLIGPRPDKPIFSYNASTDKISIISQSAFDKYYSTKDGQKQLDNLLRTSKLATFDTAQLNTGTDPTRNQDFNALKSKDGYKSLANVTPPGARAPGATGENNENSQTVGTEQPETLDGVNVRQDYGNLTKIDKDFFKGPYVYPNALRTNGQDYIQFTLYEYGTKDAKTSETSTTVEDIFKLTKRTEENNLGNVFLPIQQGISDQNMVSWADENMSPLAMALMQSAANPENIGGNIINITEKITNNDQYQKLIRQQLYGAAAGVNPLARLNGLVINPNLELLFNGPTLRPFNFTFKLSPRNSKEGETVKNIIRWFKQGSAVRTSNDNLFLKAPNVFKIKYIYGEGKQEDLHKGLNQIKTCALRSMNVNYTPDGSYMTFEDGTMTSYEMTLQFSELEPVYDLDYQESTKSDIGY
jgi:hypothetical protein